MRSRTARLVVLLGSLTMLAAAARGESVGASDGLVQIVNVHPLKESRIVANGNVVAHDRAKIGSRVSGRIAAFGVDQSGQPLDVGSRVTKGSELFHLDTTPIAAKVTAARVAAQRVEAELADLKAGTRKERIVASAATVGEIDARIEEATHDLERYTRLVEEDKTVPAKKLEEMEVKLRTLKALREAAAARLDEAKTGSTPTELAVAEAKVVEARAEESIQQIDLDDCSIKAPFDGIVVERYRSVGDYVNSAPFIEVLELVSDQRLEAEVMLNEPAFDDIVAGKTHATVTNVGRAGSVEATVTRRVDVIDPATGQFTVRIAIPEESHGLFTPGSFVRATLTNASAQNAGRAVEVVVPAAAVFADASSSYVFLAKDGVMRRTPCQISSRLSDSVVVSSGLRDGDRVVVGPSELLGDGKPLPKATAEPAARDPQGTH